MKQNKHTTRLRKLSGEVIINSRLVSFLYMLMRDHLPCGEVEKLVQNDTDTFEDVTFTNGWLATYAQDLADRLKD